ncbi:MAG: HWE histidine kinase domain-containing protein, partial [Qipengyuania sp.]
MSELEHLAESSLDHLRLVLAAGKIGIWELDLESGQVWRNTRHDEIFGYDELLPEWTYEQFLDHVIPADSSDVDERQGQALERGEDWIFECRITRPDGEERWISAAGRPVIVDGKPTKIIGHVIDITDTKRNETRLETLTAELNHRVRNMLATIRAMISMSARKATDVGRFGKALEGRVAALSRTHDLLVDNADQLFSPRTIIEGELAAFADVADRVTLEVSGRPRLKGNIAEGFTL